MAPYFGKLKSASRLPLLCRGFVSQSNFQYYGGIRRLSRVLKSLFITCIGFSGDS